MNWKPIGDQVLLKEIKRQEKTASGIIVMSNMDEYVDCEVIATGPGVYAHSGETLIPMSVESGMTVKIYSAHLGSQKQVQIDRLEYILVREHEIALINLGV